MISYILKVSLISEQKKNIFDLRGEKRKNILVTLLIFRKAELKKVIHLIFNLFFFSLLIDFNIYFSSETKLRRH